MLGEKDTGWRRFDLAVASSSFVPPSSCDFAIVSIYTALASGFYTICCETCNSRPIAISLAAFDVPSIIATSHCRSYLR